LGGRGPCGAKGSRTEAAGTPARLAGAGRGPQGFLRPKGKSDGGRRDSCGARRSRTGGAGSPAGRTFTLAHYAVIALEGLHRHPSKHANLCSFVESTTHKSATGINSFCNLSLMEPNTFLEYAAAGAVISTAGSLIALFIKDFFLAIYLDKRKENKALDDIYKKFKDPIVLSATELCSRLLEVHRDCPTVFLSSNVLGLKNTFLSKNNASDEHFRRHKLLSTVYRLCAFFGWLELYRQEITFLNGSNHKTNLNLQRCLKDIQSSFADGQLNEYDDWEDWKDFLIFREEQRAIGESMIVSNTSKSIIGYAAFKTIFEEFAETGNNKWLATPLAFFVDLDKDKDFRKHRHHMLIKHLSQLLTALDKKQANLSISEFEEYIKSIP
jgi:hypothetical protein